MGMLFVDQNADFSANALGDAGLYTSITSGLLALFETRRNARKSIHNSTPAGAGGSVLGTPTYSAGSISATSANSISFGSKPSGSHTIAVVAKMKASGTTADLLAGAFNASATTVGATYFTLYNWRISMDSTSFASGSTPPLSGNLNKTAFIDMPAVTNNELFFGVVENNVSLRLYRAKTQTLVTTATVGRDYVYNNPPSYRTVPSGAAAQDVALFAHWNRVLTQAEMDTFYADMIPQLAKSGIAIT